MKVLDFIGKAKHNREAGLILGIRHGIPLLMKRDLVLPTTNLTKAQISHEATQL